MIRPSSRKRSVVKNAAENNFEKKKIMIMIMVYFVGIIITK